jgi:hypothetical protein
METICPSRFAITVIITPSLIARDAPLAPLNSYPGRSEFLSGQVRALAEALLAGAITKKRQIERIKMTRFFSGQAVGEDSAKYPLGKLGLNGDIPATTFHPGRLGIEADYFKFVK